MAAKEKLFEKKQSFFFLNFSAFFPLWLSQNWASIFENYSPTSKVHLPLATGQVISEH